MNSSDPILPPGTSDTPTPLIRLLRSMAAEWDEIAHQVEQLGSELSEAPACGASPARVHSLQGIDLIQQRAQGQADLLIKLCRKLAEDQYFDRRRVMELVADIPFESVRAGLTAAFEGRSKPELTTTPPSDVEWL